MRVLVVLVSVLAISWARPQEVSEVQSDDPDTQARLEGEFDASERGSEIRSYEGRVFHTPRDDNEKEVTSPTKLKRRDELRTANHSRATVLNQIYAVAVGPEAELRILDNTSLKVLSGRVYFKSIETPGSTPSEDGAREIEVGSIKLMPIGTEFFVDFSENEAVLYTLDGTVSADRNGDRGDNVSGNRMLLSNSNALESTTNTVAQTQLIQWALHYPPIIALDDLPWDNGVPSALTNSVDAYRQGNVQKALKLYPEERISTSDAESLYRAALLLSTGSLLGEDGAQSILNELIAPAEDPESGTTLRLAQALLRLIAAVQFKELPVETSPNLASEFLALSYYFQSRSTRTNLTAARDAAKEAVRLQPHFGFAHARLAELEFSFGNTKQAKEGLASAFNYSTNNPQAWVLQGFLHTAENRMDQATNSFKAAIDIDPGLGNAWLGLGLSYFYLGNREEGLRHLQIAVAKEPQRALLRSYLGKAYHRSGLENQASNELSRAVSLDPVDPTPWLYSALLNRQQNRINTAVRELETSRELNDNRSVFRSGLLLDQDQAVRSANLAAIYRDAGMEEVSIREASRAVQSDYGNFSAHLFLANSYDAFRDARGVTLRYETPWANEWLLANLLAPVGASSLSQTISQHEYTRLLDQKAPVGFFSSTEYLSRGDWQQSASFYGTVGKTDYGLDVYYLSQDGERPNEDQEVQSYWASLKQQITPQDSILLRLNYASIESGDLAKYYDPSSASPTLRITEKQQPNLLLGYNHTWNPRNRTLVLGTRFDNTFTSTEATVTNLVLVTDPSGTVIPGFFPTTFSYDSDYRNEFEIYSGELQHIFQSDDSRFSTVAGGRIQFGEFNTAATLINPTNQPFFPPLVFNNPVSDQDLTTNFDRVSIYAYQNWRVVDPLLLTVGLSYDRLHYPVNYRNAPTTSVEDTKDQISPKAGLIWSPGLFTNIRAAYAQSLGGVTLDQSLRLEPNQVSGFIQSYRSLIPESLFGSQVAPTFETWGLSLDHRFPNTGTYVGITGESLNSDADQVLGTFSAQVPGVNVTEASLSRELEYQEKRLLFTLNQLLADEWSFGVRYRLSHTEVQDTFRNLPTSTANYEALLNQLSLNLLFNHPSGFFSQAEGVWFHQKNMEVQSVLPGDEFWHLNLFVGYRAFKRRVEVRVGVMNVTDQDYNLNPLNFYAAPPRERNFFASLKLNF